MGVHMESVHPGDEVNFPKDGQYVCVHYEGKLENGTTFDSSRERGLPIIFQIGKKQVIKGWDIGIKKMSVGQRAVLTCSPDYAYGKRGYPGVIPSNSTVKIDVELLQIK